MKRVVIILFSVIILVISALACTGFTYGLPNCSNEADEVFRNVVDNLLLEEGYGNVEVTAQKQLIYDMNLSELGYVYDFDIDSKDSYAIIINNDGVYEAVEVYFDSRNPYKGLIEKPVYASNMIYLYWAEDEFYLIDSETALSDAVIEELKSIAYYCGSGEMTYSYETVNFISKSENVHELAKRNPTNSEVIGLTNACVPIAGANIVHFFDRTCQNLIPNFIPGSMLGNFYLYKLDSEEVDSVARQLYSDMGTNTTGTGSSVAQFKSGMVKYCNRYGYNVVFNSCMSSNQLNYDKVKTELNNGKPVAIFSISMSIANFITIENEDNIEYLNGVNPHALIAFGYKEINYTLNNNKTRQDKYMTVSTGLMQRKTGYMKVANSSIINNAISVNIY